MSNKITLGPNQLAYIKHRVEQDAISEKERTRQEAKPCVYQPVAGYVYVIHCIGFPYYKIGMTRNNVKSRMGAHQASLPFELEVEFAVFVEDAYEVEHMIHRRHTDKWIRGEWFMLDDKDLDTIKREITELKWAKDSHVAWQEQREAATEAIA